MPHQPIRISRRDNTRSRPKPRDIRSAPSTPWGSFGIVQQSRDDPARLVQKFAPVGEIAFGKIHVLPHAETYLIHPSLSDFITRRNVAFLKELNRHNVVGDELEWRPEESIRFVAVGDIRGYRENVVQVRENRRPSTNIGAIVPAVHARSGLRENPLATTWFLPIEAPEDSCVPRGAWRPALGLRIQLADPNRRP